MKKLSIVDGAFVGLLLIVFGGVVLHAPLTVWLSTIFVDAGGAGLDSSLIIKSWKEILLGLALLLCVVILTTKKEWSVVRTKPMYFIAGFALLNLALVPVFYTGIEATIAGLFINLRFLLFFALVYVAVCLYPGAYRLFMRVFIGGAALVVGFAIMQITVLPNDFLSHIGYGEQTIAPYLTVDNNENYVRINSTLRGPNPLGLYATIVLAACLTLLLPLLPLRPLRHPQFLKKYEMWLIAGLGVGAGAALLASYSRSAALAALAAIGIIVLVVYGRRISRVVWFGFAVLALILGGSLVALRDTELVSQVILHEDPNEGNNVNSNDGHVDSLAEGTERMLRQPLGGGVGSTGSASLLTEDPIIIENQYLFIAHEVGWPGLALFLTVNYLVLAEAWRRRKQHWLALAVFASGVGIAIAGLFLPVWVDDTVSIIWWGLAGVVLAMGVRATSVSGVRAGVNSNKVRKGGGQK